MRRHYHRSGFVQRRGSSSIARKSPRGRFETLEPRYLLSGWGDKGALADYMYISADGGKQLMATAPNAPVVAYGVSHSIAFMDLAITPSGVLYGVATFQPGYTSMVYQINRTNGTPSATSCVLPAPNFNAMEVANGVLYIADQDYGFLYSWDFSGAAEFVGYITNIGTDGDLAYRRVDDNDRLYYSSDETNSNLSYYDLETNTNTWKGPINRENVFAMDWGVGSGGVDVLYGISNPTGGTPELITIDAETGNGSSTGRTFPGIGEIWGMTNMENVILDVLVAPQSGLITDEDGRQDTFTVALASPPLANVTFNNVHSDDTTEGTVPPTPLTFTTGNWSNPQTVTVTGQPDPDNVDQLYTVDVGSPTSLDGRYQGMATPLVYVTNLNVIQRSTVQFETASRQDWEDVGTMSINVSLTPASVDQVSVPFTIFSSSSADSPTDYTIPTLSPLIFSPGQTTASITINVVDDNRDEPEFETVIVDLETPTNADLGAPTRHTATIRDNDPTPSVQFTSSSQSQFENVLSPMIITARLSGPSEYLVTVPFAVTGTATNGTDYTISPTSLVFQPGETDRTIEIAVIDDLTYEGPIPETVVVTLGTPSHATLGTLYTHTASIEDNDPQPTVSFKAAGQGKLENQGPIDIEVGLTNPSAFDVTLPFTVGGTATGGGKDYTISPSPLVIPAGQSTGTITVFVVNETLHEEDETVEVTLGTPAGAILGSPYIHTATILNDDLDPRVSFRLAGQQQYEDLGAIAVIVDLSNPTIHTLTVPFSVTGGTATPGSDYTLTASPITIDPEETSGSITINVIPDSMYELDQTVELTLGPAGPDWTVGNPSTHTATIRNDDLAPRVSFTLAGQQQYEDQGAMAVEVWLDGVSEVDATVPFQVGIESTATPGTDYSIPTANPVIIPAGETSRSIAIDVVLDSLYERDETVVLTFGALAHARPGGTTLHTATIRNDDAAPQVEFTSAGQSQAEHLGTMTIEVRLSTVSGVVAVVPFSVDPLSTATAGVDYSIPTTSPITIPAGETNALITITVYDDPMYEANETVVVRLGAPTDATLGGTTSHTAAIANDDPLPSLQFSQTGQNVSETAGAATLVITLSNPSAFPITLPFIVAPASTATLGADYTITPSPIMIPPEQMSAAILVTIDNDHVDEPDETVIVTLQAPPPGEGLLGVRTTHTLTIVDPPLVSFTSATASAGENAGLMTLTLELSKTTVLPVTVPFAVSGDATNGADYTLSPASQITFAPGQTTATIEINILDDAIDEYDQEVIVTLGTPINALPDTVMTCTATIIDNDLPPTVYFSAAGQLVSETAGTATITVELSLESEKPVEVPFGVDLASTAISPDDYTVVTLSPLAISPGQTTGSIAVQLVSDWTDEPDEIVVLTLGTPTNAVPGTPTQHILTIVDPPKVSFAVAAQSKAENGGTMTITVGLSKSTSLPVAVPFTIDNTVVDSATLGADYTITLSPITIPADETAKTITINVVNDGLYEHDEKVVVKMGTPTHGLAEPITTHTATIENDDPMPLVSFTTASQVGAEDSGTMTITVRLSQVSGVDVVLPFNVTGTATGGGVDFTISPSPVTIAAGQPEAAITITVMRDAIPEAAETVIVTMGNPIAAELGTVTTHTATILDTAITTIGLFEPAASIFSLRTSNTSGPADYTFGFGEPGKGWNVLVGDWNADGATGVGLYSPQESTFYLTNAYVSGFAEHTFGYGEPGKDWMPIVGDWDGNGSMGVGLYDPHSSTFYLTNSLETGFAEYTFGYGEPDKDWMPIVGDWNGDRSAGVGLYDPHSSTFYLTNSLATGFAEHTFGFGEPDKDWMPMVGDWNGDRSAGVGLFDPHGSLFYLTNAFVSGYAQHTFGYGEPEAGWKPLVGDWDGSGTAGVGLCDTDPAETTFYLTNSLQTGVAEYTALFGQAGHTYEPIVGYWSPNGKAAPPAASAVDQIDLAGLVAPELGSISASQQSEERSDEPTADNWARLADEALLGLVDPLG